VAERLQEYDVFALPLSRIYYDADFNCRGQFTLESVSELAESIRQKGGGVELRGLDFPVVVQPTVEVVGTVPSGFDYRLIAGHRRFRAVEFFLKWANIPAMVRHELTDYQARLLNFTENLERKDLNMLQEAIALKRLYPDGVSLRQANKELHRPTKWIAARFRLLDLPVEIQEMAANGLLSQVSIERLYKEAPEEQLFLAEKTAEARRRGSSGKLPGLDETYKRRFRFRRTKEQINAMILRMFEAGVNGLATRALAWAMAEIDDAALIKDIEEENQKGSFCNS
jgi:ParB/RepB/Spo0J family partition protein